MIKPLQKLVSGVMVSMIAMPLVIAAEPEEVKLVIQITVDQLRGDAFSRFGKQFTRGGFRYLLDNGVHYTNAHYPYSDTETAPGHATLATGANPARHGVVSNDWIDAQTGAFVYNTEDDRHSLIGAAPKAHQGVSPRNLVVSTFSDEFVLHNGGASRAFSVSPKDRGAILPGGHAGKAFWYMRVETSSGFARHIHPLRTLFQDLADQSFTAPIPIYIGGINKVNPIIQSSMEGRNGILLANRSPFCTNRPCTKANLRNLPTCATERSIIHNKPPGFNLYMQLMPHIEVQKHHMIG